MDDIKKNISDKAAHLEKEGTPLRGLITCSRLFVEKAYKSTVSTFSPAQAQNLYAERVSLVSRSLHVFKHNNQRVVDYCRLYPSTVVGATVAAVAIPTFFVFRFRTMVFAATAAAVLSSGAIDILSMDTSYASSSTDKKE